MYRIICGDSLVDLRLPVKTAARVEKKMQDRKGRVGNERKNLSAEQASSPIFAHDCYETPPWCVRALCRLAPEILDAETVLDPCAGRGVIAREIDDARGGHLSVLRHDIREIEGVLRHDFLAPRDHGIIDAVVMNPPFRLAAQFIQRAIEVVRPGGLVAMFQRCQLLEGIDRYSRIWSDGHLAQYTQFSTRVNCYPEGHVDHRVSGMMSFAWYLFRSDSRRAAYRGSWISSSFRDYGRGALLPQEAGLCWSCRHAGGSSCSRVPAQKQLAKTMVAWLRENTDTPETLSHDVGTRLERLCGGWEGIL